MISLRGIAMSLVVHGVAAALVSVSAAIHSEAPFEDVAAIPVELVLETESAPVMPAEPVEAVVEAPVLKQVAEPQPEIQTASVAPANFPRRPEPELVTRREVPVKIPPVVEEKSAFKKVESKSVMKKIPKTVKKVSVSSQRKQVAALAAGKGSIGKQRSTDGIAAESSYNSKILARLRAAKKYPAAARGKGIEGTAILSFTISSSGRLASARVVKGAGDALLDSAVIAMARNAAPFPAFPDSISKSQMIFRVPVQFKIN